jgi:hypothetical protein
MLAAATRASDTEKSALCHNYIGATLRVMGKWEESRRDQLDGLQLARSLPNRVSIFHMRYNKASSATNGIVAIWAGRFEDRCSTA